MNNVKLDVRRYQADDTVNDLVGSELGAYMNVLTIMNHLALSADSEEVRNSLMLRTTQGWYSLERCIAL